MAACNRVKIEAAASARMAAAVGGFLQGAGVVFLVYVVAAVIGAAATGARERSRSGTPAVPGAESRLSRAAQAIGPGGPALVMLVGILVVLAATFWAVSGSACRGGGPMPDGRFMGYIHYPSGLDVCVGTLSVFPPASVHLATAAGALFGSGLLILIFAL